MATTTSPTLQAVQEAATRQAHAIRDRTRVATEKVGQLKEIATELQGAIERREVDRIGILTADYETARASYQATSKDLAVAMVGVTHGTKDIGVALKELESYAPDEQRIIDSANLLVKECEGQVAGAESALRVAEAKTGFLGIRARAIAAANAELDSVTQRLEKARLAIDPAREMAEQKKRERLQNMNLDQSLQMLQLATSQSAQITRDGIVEAEANLTAMEEGGTQLMEDLRELAQEIADDATGLQRIGGELTSLRQEQDEHPQNSPSWVEVRGRIEAKLREQAEMETKHNIAFSLSQDGQRFFEAYKIQETAQREGLRFSHQFIALLETGVQRRTELFQSSLGVVRVASNMEAMSMLDSVGIETDQRMAEDGARFVQSMRKQSIDRMQRTPDDIRYMREVTGTVVEGEAIYERKLAELLDDFHKNWGTNPTYDDRSKQSGEMPPAPAA